MGYSNDQNPGHFARVIKKCAHLPYVFKLQQTRMNYWLYNIFLGTEIIFSLDLHQAVTLTGSIYRSRDNNCPSLILDIYTPISAAV
jgi:hypothetical protein